MAYTPATLSLLQGLIQGGYNLWLYTTTDAIGTVTGASYFSDAADKGLGLGDVVWVIETAGPTFYTTQVTAVSATAATVTDTATYAASSQTITTLTTTTLTATTGTVNGVPPAEAETVDPSQKFTLFEDFYGTWAIGDAGPADTWSTTAGAGTATEVATTVAGSVNGTVTMKSSTDDGTNAQNSTTFTAINLGFRADQGGLAMEVRLKLSAITAVALFVGFTDTISTTVELPIFLTAADIDSDATDACGVGFDTDGTTDEFFHGGVKAGTDTVPAYSGTAPVADTYVTIRVEVSAAGAVIGYINGTAIGAAVANAVTITTPLTPMVVVSSRSAAARTLTMDYIWVQQNR